MKISLSLFCSVSLILAVLAPNFASAQYGYKMGDYPMQGAGGYQSFSGDLYGGQAPSGAPGGILGRHQGQAGAGAPGRLWLRSNLADRGLGYTGHYFTVGAKNRLFEDRFDGRWLVEGRLHHSLEEDGGFFSNIGLERVFSIDAAEADVSMSVWYDYDGDARGNFAHEFHQIGASAQIKTRKWDLIGNGYFPVGTTDYAFGDPTGVNCFAGNQVVLIPGIDSALQGFDTVIRMRPEPLAMVNGNIDFGGYHYRSDLVGSFAGGRARLGIQVLRGAMVSAEVNHDDRFETTGVLQVGWLFGANASGRGHEYSGLGRDLESVSRNDHIVRFNREAVVLMDPLTGLAYNVIHVDNRATPGGADGSAERPFANLLDAQVNSNTYDVIAVSVGDGTDRNYDQGIVLQDFQRLWGVGFPFLVPDADGTFFELCGLNFDQRPTLSNDGGVAVVTMANGNDVAGINIDGTGATFGIRGSGNGGSVRENEIRNANSHGVQIVNAAGDWLFENNLAERNGGSGISVQNHNDGTADLVFRNNQANENGLDGIMVQNANVNSLTFRNNTTNNNVRHGLHVNNFTPTGTDPLLIVNHIGNNNLNRGIMLDTGTGPVRILNTTVNGNTEAGLTIRNWNHLNAGEQIIIGNQNGGASNFNGNGALGNIEFLLETPGIVNNVLVTGIESSDGVRGIYGRADGLGTTLNIDIVDNRGFNNNVNDGIKLMATNSGIVNTRIGSTAANAPLILFDNAFGGGSGISLTAEGISPNPASQMNAVVDNVFISNHFNQLFVPGGTERFPTIGIEVISDGSAVANVDVVNSQIGSQSLLDPPARDTTIGFFGRFDNDGAGLINRIRLNNLLLINDFGVIIGTLDDTFTDILIANSVIRPHGIQGDGTRGDNTPFDDGAGTAGIVISASGRGVLSGQNNRTDRPDIDPFFPLYSPVEIVSDGLLDNLTRVQLQDNTIRDFTENGVDIRTFGDAQMLLNMVGNSVINNGAGYDSDGDNDNVYTEGIGPVDINHLSFFDGVRIRAYDQSTLSANIFQNTFVDNFERGLRLNTFNRAVMNVSMRNNVFFGNDRGEDIDNTVPDLGTGIFQNDAALTDSGVFDFEAVNNAEFYIRSHESPILLNNDGVPVDLGGTPLPADTLGFFFPGNVGFDIFGNPVALGAAQMNLSMVSNSLQFVPPDLRDFSVAPGDFTLGLDGSTNGFTNATFPLLTNVPLTFAELLIQNETNFFNLSGF
jgi:hypothetical protein